MKQLLEAIAVTVEVMGQQISPVGAAMMVKDLSGYKHEDVLAALKLVRTGSQRFSLKAVIDALDKVCPDGRPGPDEAWAMIPRDEQSSVVWTEEMSQAYGIALPLLNEGDQVAARMAFKESYARIVEENKQAGVAVRWTPSLGRDPAMRETVLTEAVRLGRLGVEHASRIMPLPDLSQKLMIEGKREISAEQMQANLARMRNMIGSSRVVSQQPLLKVVA